MSELQLIAFKDEENAYSRLKNREIILQFLYDNRHNSFNYEQITLYIERFRGDSRSVQPRLSELHKSGAIRIVGDLDNKSAYQFVKFEYDLNLESDLKKLWRILENEISETELQNIKEKFNQ